MPTSSYFLLTLTAISLGVTGCAKTQSPGAEQNQAQSAGQGPAVDGNLVPVSGTAAPVQQSTGYQNQPQASGSYAGGYDSVGSQADSGDTEQVAYAPQPPPPLPDYSQPPAPGDNYIWTPGYWSYSNQGYYWVPGAWVLAPYVGALWTPPYWDYYDGRYRWHHGYWGQHIGFYGGIDYGFGYTGRGYYGGYWNGGRFDYNRAVTNVNPTVHNVYDRRVANRTNSRISYNGGPGGIEERPIPAELAAGRERVTPPVEAQVRHVQEAAANREQFASTNHGRPTVVAQAQPLAANYRAPAPRPEVAVHPREQQRPVAQTPQPQRNERTAEPLRAASRPVENQRPELNRPVPAAHPSAPSPRPVEPTQVEPRQIEPRQIEPRQVQPPQVQPRQVQPRQVQPRQVQPRQVQPERPIQEPARQAAPAQQRFAPERAAPQQRPEPARPAPAVRPEPQGPPAPAAHTQPQPGRAEQEKEHR